VLWTASPLAGWLAVRRGYASTSLLALVSPAVVSLALGLAAFAWARETLSRTAVNRRLARTFAVYLVEQIVLSLAGWMTDMPLLTLHRLFLFAWGLTYSMIAVWLEAAFAVPAAACMVSLLLASAYPALLYPLMAVCNLAFTVVVLAVWFPRQDLARLQEHRTELRARAGRWLRGSRDA
jgi:hypothetical protein